MLHARMVVRASLLVGAAAIVFACDSDTDLIGPRPAESLFQSYVAIGNSITAGFQSDGINDSTQREAYPRLLALQMGTRYAYPSLAMPGCRPPLAVFQTQTRVTLPGQPQSTDATCALRDPASVTSALNNVAVPGAATADPTATVGPSQNVLTQLVLGGKTMVQRALDAAPTFATVWIGNNDVLQPAISGMPATATPQATFEQNYSAMMEQLLDGAPNVQGVLIGVVQAASAPILFTARALQSPAFVAALSTAAGKTIAVDPATCTPTTTSLIAIPIVSAIRAGTHPPIIACEKTATPPLGDIFVLDAAEQVQVQGIIDGYNAYIQAKADSLGFGFYDPNTTLAALTAIDPVLSTKVPNLASVSAPFGQFVSLDGIHPSGITHVRIANDLIAVINARFGTQLAVIPTS